MYELFLFVYSFSVRYGQAVRSLEAQRPKWLECLRPRVLELGRPCLQLLRGGHSNVSLLKCHINDGYGASKNFPLSTCHQSPATAAGSKTNSRCTRQPGLFGIDAPASHSPRRE